LQTARVLIERQTEASNQKRNGKHDAYIEQVDEAIERVSGGVFDMSMAT
jgi:hypothetical protein